MNHLEKLIQQLTGRVFGWLVFSQVLTILFLGLIYRFVGSNWVLIGLLAFIMGLVISVIFSSAIAKLITQPINYLWQAILHVSPQEGSIPAPNLDNIKIGHELISSLVLQIYQLASNSTDRKDAVDKQATIGQAATIAHNLPLPVFVMAKDSSIRFVNEA